MVIIDIHTHVYPPSYMQLLQSRATVPYVRTFLPSTESRLVILPGEDDGSTAQGRPIGPEYYDISHKIAFMDQHKIGVSVISLANPWLDFIDPDQASATAELVNDDINAMCEQYPGRLYAFAALPMSGGTAAVIKEVKRVKGLRFVRGAVFGTSGMGEGLDDPRMEGVWEALQELELPVFLHPHYGLPGEVYGPRKDDYGHVLQLALGFPLETTIAVSRMILSGVWDRWQSLTMLLAHSGGTLPFLAGRLESCIVHDSRLKKEGKLGSLRDIWDILKKNILLDAVIYSEVGLKAAAEVSGSDRVLFAGRAVPREIRKEGPSDPLQWHQTKSLEHPSLPSFLLRMLFSGNSDRLMHIGRFRGYSGTDHPFFPPLEESACEWPSVTTNYDAISRAFGWGSNAAAGVLGDNAERLLNLRLEQ